MIPLKEALIRKNRSVNFDHEEIRDFIVKNYKLYNNAYHKLMWEDLNIDDIIKINNDNEVDIIFPNKTNKGKSLDVVTLEADRKLTKLTSDKFTFGIIEGNFYCGGTAITSLEGAPKACYNFSCQYCHNLTSLKGIENMRCNIGSADDKYISVPWSRDGALYNAISVGEINCSKCDKLKSLEGAPEFISTDVTGARIQKECKFNALTCTHCSNLTSLKGLIRYEVPAFVNLTGCRRLQSIDEIINYFEMNNQINLLYRYTKDERYLKYAGYRFPAKFKKIIEEL